VETSTLLRKDYGSTAVRQYVAESNLTACTTKSGSLDAHGPCGHAIPPDHYLMRSIMQAVRCLGWKQRKRKVRARILRATEVCASTLWFTGASLSHVQRPHAAMQKLRIVTV
jgi:hypothetical protein